MPVFDFRPGRSIKNANPQLIGQELERIRAEKGELKPADVLAEAESENSPLHLAFEWDDSVAAQHHRLNQARKLIVSIRVLNSIAAKPVQAYVSVRTPDKGRQYVPTTEALSDEVLKARVLDEVRNFVESLERRYAAFKEVATVLATLKQRVG